MYDVAIVGVGANGKSSLTLEAKEAIERADCLIGAPRMLQSAPSGKPCHAAIAARDICDFIRVHREYPVFAVLMSGDTGFFSGTKRLLPLLDGFRVKVLPGLSSLSVLCARLGASYEDVTPVSIHGRTHDIVPDLLRHQRVFALVGGEDGMAALCCRLCEAGFGAARLSVGERLGYPDEKITIGTAWELAKTRFESLAVALIEHDRPQLVFPALPDAANCPLPEEIRAICLSKLRLTADALCWVVGEGCGTMAVELANLAEKGCVYALEPDPRQTEALCRRVFAANVHAMALTSAALQSLPAPTHVLLLDGEIEPLAALARAKNPHARLVAVTAREIAPPPGAHRRTVRLDAEAPVHILTWQT